MQNESIWKPSKFIIKNGKIIASRNKAEVSISSRLIVDILGEYFEKYLRLYVRGRLLDLGCGKVPLYAFYKNYITENICIDWGQTLHKNPYLDYEFDLNKNLNIEDETFDTVILSDVLEHIRNPELLISEAYRVLNKNGKILISVPFYYWLHEVPHDYFRYTHFALKSMLEDAGFSVLILEAYGGMPEIVTDILSKSLISIPILGKSVSVVLQKITRRFIKTKLGKRVSKNSSSHFPLGYFVVAEKR